VRRKDSAKGDILKPYLIFTRLIALAVLLQAAFIGLGTFTILNDADDGKRIDPDDYNAGQAMHSVGAMVLSLLVIIALVVALTKVKAARKHAGLLFLVVLLQWVFAMISFEAPVAGLLHGANAIVILGVAISAEQMAKRAEGAEPVAV
jgi:heme A synthase